MPDAAIVAYYRAVASKILPFLRGRRVAVRHQFDHTLVFRRHPTPQMLRGAGLTPPMAQRARNDPRWIRIEEAATLMEIVRLHGYEFFPHLEGDDDLWFALDIDIRSVPVPLGMVAVRTTLDVLEERQVKYLLTYSGGNGFHIRWAFAPAEVPKQKWGFLRGIVRALRDETERRLQASRSRARFYRYLPRGDPITELSAVDQAAQRSILFDELILKSTATIRAPFSLHMKRRLVAVPLSPRLLSAFRPSRDATMGRARTLPTVRLPKNPVRLFL